MKRQGISRNPVILWLLVAFFVLMSILTMISCYFAYQQKKSELVRSLDDKLTLFAIEFRKVKDASWEIYLPITEIVQNGILIKNYFEETKNITIQEKIDLNALLFQMAMKDKRISWIALYAPERKHNYLYMRENNKMIELSEDFVYLEELRVKDGMCDIYGRKDCVVEGNAFNNIVIVGGTSTQNMNGSVLIGYDVTAFDEISRDDKGLTSLQFCICWDGWIVYNSNTTDNFNIQKFESKRSGIYTLNGEKWQVQVADNYKGRETIFYMVEKRELFWLANQWSFIILGIVLIATFFAFIVYRCMLQSVTKEVEVILNGLTILGNDQLDYRICKKFHQPEMSAIADAVNKMAVTLEENIESKSKFRKLQEEAEFSALQAKFNPHFLYNTLEIFRRRCYQNGDEETANMIAETAILFRGFIGATNFIPIREELSFCKRYLTIYHERYRNMFEIFYDIDTDVLKYGIIRNVFQPLIENYFEHGYDSGKTDNYILIKGCLLGEEDILFTVEDNGKGVKEEKLVELNKNLKRPILSEQESYGLRNLDKRLRIFYGEKYGLNLFQNTHNGLSIEILIKQKKLDRVKI